MSTAVAPAPDRSHSVSESTIAEMAAALVREISPQCIFLFGSHARGDAAADSDVDFLIVESEPFTASRSRRRELSRIRKVLSRFPVAKDILLFSAAELDQWRTAQNHVIARCLREGRLLYERP